MSKVIVGTGSYLPEWVVTNDDLEKMDLNYDRKRSGKSLDQWSWDRFGIRSRHKVRPGESTSDLGTKAAERALEDAGIEAGQIGLLLLHTFTTDYRAPSSAALVQANLGIHSKFFQLDVGCVGFVDASITASALMDAMQVEYALVIGSDAFTIHSDPRDFMAQSLFGDGAGAVVLKNMPESPYGIRSFFTAGDGSQGKYLWVPGGGSKEPITQEMLDAKRHYVVWSQKDVYTFAVQKLCESSQAAAERAGWKLDEVDWFIPHQTGRNIILDAARRMEQPEDKFIIVIDHTGNTSGPSIPIALDEANREGKFKDGDKLILPAMGAGLAWGALAVVWHDTKNGHISGNGNGHG